MGEMAGQDVKAVGDGAMNIFPDIEAEAVKQVIIGGEAAGVFGQHAYLLAALLLVPNLVEVFAAEHPFEVGSVDLLAETGPPP
jgi:hypothetical protein